MAWASIGTHAPTTVKLAGSSVSLVPTADLAVGEVVMAIWAWDCNGGVAGALTGFFTVTDTKGHTWTILRTHQSRPAGSLSGVIAGAAITQLTSVLGTADTVTITDTNSAIPVSKACVLRRFTVGSGKTWQLVDVNSNHTTSTATSLNTTCPASGTLVSAAERLWVGVGASETAITTGTLDADYTQTTTVVTGGTDSSNVRLRQGWRIASIDVDAFNNQTGATSTDHAGILLVLAEIDSGPPPTVTVRGRRTLLGVGV